MFFKKIPFDRVEWVTFSFLVGVLVLSLTAVPLYLYFCGIDLFLFCLTAFYMVATGISITLGYHRLFSHLSFKAKLPVRLFVAIFGAAAWENSILDWCSGHRRHHKHVDHEDDPYNINEGFFYAHMGWMLFKLKPEPPMDNVADLRKDKLVMWQHKYIFIIAALVGFIIPTLICGLKYGTWQGALGGFLIAGVLRTTLVQQATFFINSACHYFGSQPYSSTHSARNSWFMALLTYGEGYHNFHHEFQHDYRNGVKPWQWDPTKWTIWILSKVGLTSDLRRVSNAKILLAELNETRKKVNHALDIVKGDQITETAKAHLEASIAYLHNATEELSTSYYEVQKAVTERIEISKKKVILLRKDIDEALEHLEAVIQTTLIPSAI